MNKTISIERENKMGVMPVGRLLFTMAMPMVISMLVQALYNIVDSIFVGMISAENTFGLTAISLAFPIQNLMIAFATGTGVGVNSFLSRSLGENNKEAVNRAAGNGIFATIITSVAFAIFGFFFSHWFFGTQSQIPAVISGGTDYLWIVSVFSLGLFLEVMMERLLQATGKTNLSMISQLVGAIINIILDPIFILPAGTKILFFTLPFGLNMGTAGAAIATVIGQWVAAIVAILLNVFLNHEIKFGLRYLKPHAGIIATIYKVGLPSIFMAAVGSFLTLAMNKILTIGEAVKYGITPAETEQTGVTVYGIYFKLQSFVFMPIFGLNNGMIPIVAYNYGARKKKRILSTIRYSVIAAVTYMALGLLVFQTCPSLLLRLFSENAMVQDMGVPALKALSLCFIFAGVCIITISTMQALGQGVASLLISLIRQIVVILPLAYIFAITFGIDVIWYAYPIAEFVALVISILFFLRSYKRFIAPLGDEEPILVTK